MKRLSKDSSTKRTEMIRAALIVLCIAVMTSMMPVMGMTDKVSAAENDLITEIDAVELTFETPKCGHEVGRNKNTPAVKTPNGADYSVSSSKSGYWLKRPVSKDSKNYSGKMKGGNSYYAVIYLENSDGHPFKANSVSGQKYEKYTGSLRINGKTIKPAATSYDRNERRLILAFAVDIQHTWDSGIVTKEPTASAEGVRTFTCSGCNETRTESIPKNKAQAGEGGSSVGRGADYVLAEQYIKSKAADADLAGTAIAPMMLRAAKRTKKAIVLGWNPVGGAVKYTVFGTMCGSKYKMKKLGEVTGTNFKVTKIKRKLKKTYYKFIVVARDSKDKVIQTTKTVHISPKGNKKKSVYKGVSLKANVGGKYKKVSALTLTAGQTMKLKYGPVLYKKTKVKRHVKIRFESSDPGIATVGLKGQITAVKPGTCTIFAYAQNGVYKALTVTVQ